MDLIRQLPKADVHLHMECCLDADSAYLCASRYSKPIALTKAEFILKVQDLNCLDDLLSLCDILLTIPETYQDIYEMFSPYYKKINEQGVVYIEPAIPFGCYKNIHPSEVIKGALLAAQEAESMYGIKTNFIYSFVRSHPVAQQSKTLLEMQRWKENIAGIGIASNEFSGPSYQIKPIFDLARQLGFCRDNNATAHTGEETPPNYIIDSLHSLGLKRIDHGVRAQEDEYLMRYLGSTKFPIAMCPASNKKLKVNDRFCGGKYSYHKFIEHGCLVSINSDDPFLGSYLDDVYEDFYEYYGDQLSLATYVELVKNAFAMGFMGDDEKKHYLLAIDSIVQKSGYNLI